MDQGGYGGGTGHRVRQPNVQGELRRFPDKAARESKTEESGNLIRGGFSSEFRKAYRAKDPVGKYDTDEKTKVADAIDDECFSGCFGGLLH